MLLETAKPVRTIFAVSVYVSSRSEPFYISVGDSNIIETISSGSSFKFFRVTAYYLGYTENVNKKSIDGCLIEYGELLVNLSQITTIGAVKKYQVWQNEK